MRTINGIKEIRERMAGKDRVMVNHRITALYRKKRYLMGSWPTIFNRKARRIHREEINSIDVEISKLAES